MISYLFFDPEAARARFRLSFSTPRPAEGGSEPSTRNDASSLEIAHGGNQAEPRDVWGVAGTSEVKMSPAFLMYIATHRDELRSLDRRTAKRHRSDARARRDERARPADEAGEAPDAEESAA